jgi:signal transduction histidine kinase
VRIFLSSDCIDVPAQMLERTDIAWICPNRQDAIPEAHLYIWDYTPGLDLQSYILARRNGQHLVVTDPKNLDSLSEVQNFVCILLRPVAPSTLKAFVEFAFKTWEGQQHVREAEALRLDRDTLLQCLLEVNLKLQEYDRERTNFLARALHDFRTPLTALHGYCGLLAEGKLGEVTAAQRELLERMRHSTRRLARLAGGTLDLLIHGRIQKRVAKLETDIGQIFERALDDIFPFVQDKSVHVDTRITPPEGILFLEPEQIQQVLVNLLENSCRFTPRNGHIKIRGYTVHRDDANDFAEAYRVDISDSGPGVPANLAERIFEEYSSYSGGADRSGGGLGLAICRAIITAHGGTIWTKPSEAGGKFSFILPLSPFRAASMESFEDDGLARQSSGKERT